MNKHIIKDNYMTRSLDKKSPKRRFGIMMLVWHIDLSLVWNSQLNEGFCPTFALPDSNVDSFLSNSFPSDQSDEKCAILRFSNNVVNLNHTHRKELQSELYNYHLISFISGKMWKTSAIIANVHLIKLNGTPHNECNPSQLTR